MNFVEQRILADGVVKPGNVLKVDSFLNHQMDIGFMEQVGQEMKRRFDGKPITKVLTIETSGIAVACFVAREFGVPMVFAKKSRSINLDGKVYVADVDSYTHKTTNHVMVAKKFLSDTDHVLIVDDFLANGCALQGLISIVLAAGATVRAWASWWKRASRAAATCSGGWATSWNLWPLWSPWTRTPGPSLSAARKTEQAGAAADFAAAPCVL